MRGDSTDIRHILDRLSLGLAINLLIYSIGETLSRQASCPT